MNSPHDRCDTNDCALRYICHCFRLTEDVLEDAIAGREINNLKDIRRHTGAGDACMACHDRLRQFLDRRVYSSSDPICSVK